MLVSPRRAAGIGHRAVCDYLCHVAPPFIIYSSCNAPDDGERYRAAAEAIGLSRCSCLEVCFPTARHAELLTLLVPRSLNKM